MFLLRKSSLFWCLILLVVCSACVAMVPREISNKKNLTMAMGVYNSQYMQYMNALGYIKTADGEWTQVSEPVLSEEKKELLRKKKELMTELYSLIQLYDAMVTGTMPYSATTEQSMLNLVDQLAELAGGDV